MPYEISLTKKVTITTDREEYINECCIGGDIVMNHLLPAVREGYAKVDSIQEDWGWQIWFRAGNVPLEINIHTDDSDTGEFRIHLVTYRKKWGLFKKVIDLPELEGLRRLVEAQLEGWVDAPMRVERLDENFM